MAFFVIDPSRRVLDDPSFLKLQARTRLVSTPDGGENWSWETKVLDVKKCTADDWKDFWPIKDPQTQYTFDEIESKSGWFCLDWSDDPDNYEIFGSRDLWLND